MGKKYSFKKTVRKFLEGNAIVLVATVVALLIDNEPEEVLEILLNVGDNFILLIPVFGGFVEAVRNAVKFFIKNKKGQ